MEKIINQQSESQKLIEHIEDAKGWLEKAKDYYKQANPTHAEMTLNLAQAEVKHAWELSRNRYVTNKQTNFSKHKFNNLIAVAASILVFFGLIFGLQKSEINKYLAGIIKPAVKNASIGSNPKLSVVKDNQKEAEEGSFTIRPEFENSVEPVSSISKAEEQVQSEPAATIAVDTKPERSELESIQNQTRVRQVSQFAIDEEALTKEASHSLRNGK